MIEALLEAPHGPADRLELTHQRAISESGSWTVFADRVARAATARAAVDVGRPLRERLQGHSLRHFCASSLLAEGAPLAAVAGHLGDTVDTVSRTYVHWLRDDRDVPAAVLDRVLGPLSRILGDDRSDPTVLSGDRPFSLECVPDVSQGTFEGSSAGQKRWSGG